MLTFDSTQRIEWKKLASHSYLQSDDYFAVDEDLQIDTGRFDKAIKQTLNADNLEKLFAEKMQIKVMGEEEEDAQIEEDESDESPDEGDENEYFKEDNKISQKHTRHTNVEERDKEDMDFPDEVDTPLKDARLRF